MNLIKLPMDLGLEVAEILREKGYEPRKNNLGILSLEFTEEELNLITELEFINPRANCLEGIEFLSHLKILKISTKGATAFNNCNASITDKDIEKISKLSSLKSLSIVNQSDITFVDLDSLVNLEEFSLIRNFQIDKIKS